MAVSQRVRKLKTKTISTMCRFMIKKYPKLNFRKSPTALKNEEDKDL